MDNNLILDIKRAAKELKVRERKLIAYLIKKKYIYSHNVGNKLKPYVQYTRETSNYFIEKLVKDKNGIKKREIFFTKQGIKFFEDKVKEIDKDRIKFFIDKSINFLKDKMKEINKKK